MDAISYWLARGLIAVLQALPLRLVARLGRLGGSFGYALDARHRRAAIENLTGCFGHEQSPRAIRALARENFRRIGETFACAARTAAMSNDEIRTILEIAGTDPVIAAARAHRGIVAAIGHFGNFELYARGRLWLDGYQAATTYRALRQPSLNRLLQTLRAKSGCLYFERRFEAAALREAMNRQRTAVGFLADQHAGNRGLPVPFFGRICSTSAAPALFALRYNCLLVTAICFRTGLGRWRIEVGAPVATRIDGRARPVEAIMLDVNRAFEQAVRRDPANWFWVHRRWKPGKHRAPSRSAPAADNDTTNPPSA